MFVDWAGLTLSIVDRATGQLHDVFIFVGALGISNMTYLEGALAQTLPPLGSGHTRARSSTSAGRPPSWCPTTRRPGSPWLVATSRRQIGPTPRWRPTTAR
jgi:transposase